MFLLDWYREWIQIRTSLKEADICDSCETLKYQLEIANLEKKQLLDRIMEKPEPIREAPAPQITRPMNIPWNVRRQMLEQEDRVKAELLRKAAQPDTKINEAKETEAFEQELKDAEQRRQEQANR